MIKIDGMNTSKGKDSEDDYRASIRRRVWCCNTLGFVGLRCPTCKIKRTWDEK